MPVVTSYTSILGSAVADTDIFLVIDVSDTSMAATGTDKNITRVELPAALGLGKLTQSGFSGTPTFYDPSSSAWQDKGWQSRNFAAAEFDEYVGFGAHSYIQTSLVDLGTSRLTYNLWVAESDDTLKYATAEFQVVATDDGANRNARVLVDYEGIGGAFIFISEVQALLQGQGVPGQTLAILDIRDSNDALILDVRGDKKIGFFGATPVTQRTGVAVNSAGIHAALVSLGLITA